MDDIELEDPVALLPDNIDDTDYFSPLRISRSGWKLRAGKRAAIWKLRGGKRAAQGALWKLRSMKRDGILDDKRAELWKLRTGKGTLADYSFFLNFCYSNILWNLCSDF